MAYQYHSSFETPEAETKIWRYVDLSKLLSILTKSELYFCKQSILQRSDPFEGELPKKNAKPPRFEELTSIERQDFNNSEIEYNKYIQTYPSLINFYKHQLDINFINCWHISEYESAAMWKLYSTGNQGFAIQSTVGRLIKSVEEYNEFQINIGKIRYIDYEKDIIDVSNVSYTTLCKRLEFEHEKELRAVIWTLQHGLNSFLPNENKFGDVNGLSVPININILIENIFISPTAENWISQLISELLKSIDKPNY